MKEKWFSGHFNTGLLFEEIREAFPVLVTSSLELYPGMGNRFCIYPEENGVKISVPDDFENLDTLTVLIEQHDSTKLTKAEECQKMVLDELQGAVGIRVYDLSNKQVRAVLATMLHRFGMVDDDLRILPIT